MLTISRQQAMDKIIYCGNKIFSVDFIKKDGSRRTLTGRRHCSKKISGKGLKFNPLDRNMIPVFDLAKKGFRMVSLSTVTGLRMDGEEFEVV